MLCFSFENQIIDMTVTLIYMAMWFFQNVIILDTCEIVKQFHAGGHMLLNTSQLLKLFKKHLNKNQPRDNKYEF